MKIATASDSASKTNRWLLVVIEAGWLRGLKHRGCHPGARQYSERLTQEKGIPLQIRVGINTGDVVLRSVRKDDLHADYVPSGTPPA